MLALEGEEPDAIRAGICVALGDTETKFRVREDNWHMNDKASRACHALCHACVFEEIRRRKGTTTAEHLKLALAVIDRPAHFPPQKL
jgi:hypothetical protein